MSDKPFLSDVQKAVLSAYAAYDGPTVHSYGSLTTWKVLVRRGLLARSQAGHIIETEITEAGRRALAEGGADA